MDGLKDKVECWNMRSGRQACCLTTLSKWSGCAWVHPHNDHSLAPRPRTIHSGPTAVGAETARQFDSCWNLVEMKGREIEDKVVS